MDDQRARYRLIVDARPSDRYRAFTGPLFGFEGLDFRGQRLLRNCILTLGRRLVRER